MEPSKGKPKLSPAEATARARRVLSLSLFSLLLIFTLPSLVHWWRL